MKVITVSSLKGGTGKTSLAILTANRLKELGKKTLIIDLDIQNGTSFYYLPFSDDDRNISKALDTGDMTGNIIKPDDWFLPDLIQSDYSLLKKRDMDTQRLKNLLANADYDYIIIDAPPTLDNVVLSAYRASDLIISPCRLSNADFKGLIFLQEELENLAKLNHHRILINFFKEPKTDNPNNEANQLLDLFKDQFDCILKTHIPNTSLVQKIYDTGIRLDKSKYKAPLYNAINELIREVFNGKK